MGKYPLHFIFLGELSLSGYLHLFLYKSKKKQNPFAANSEVSTLVR